MSGAGMQNRPGGELRISVVIPVLDEAARIGTRLSELARCSWHEVIVVDGGSQDGTRAIVRSVPGVQLAEAPRGRGSQMNEGARRATGDALLFLHADVSLPQDAASHIRSVMAQPGVAAGAFRTWTVADDHDRRPWWRFLLHIADLRSRYSGLPYGDQAIFVRRDLFWRVGGFPDLTLMEDLELSRRLRRVGRLRIARATVRVSGRRFIERPLFYAALVRALPVLFRCGVQVRSLSRRYGAVR